MAEKVKARLTLGEFGIEEEREPVRLPTFRQYADHWLHGYIHAVRRGSTFERYQDVLTRHVYPALGNKPLDEIRRGEIKALLLDLHRKGLSSSSLGLVRDVLSGPLGFAVDEELIPANPVQGILRRLNLEREKRLQIEPLTPEEARLLLETCRQTAPEHYPFFLCALRTGMRLGELLGLRPGDVDFHGRFIQVQRSYKRGKFDKTKTGKTRRVDMSDQLAAELRQVIQRLKREGLKEGKEWQDGTLFQKDGRPMEQNYIRRVFKRLLGKAGLRDMRLHDLRHTFASLLLSNGESPVYVKEQLGHSSIQMTVDIYGHLIPSSNRKAVNRLDDMHPDAPYLHPEKKKGQNP